jgi:hypothetical protein
MIDIHASFLHYILSISVGNTVSDVEEHSKKYNVLRVMHAFEVYHLDGLIKRRGLCIYQQNFATQPFLA